LAKRQSVNIEGFATDLGALLGTAVNKAESWLSERDNIVKHLTDVRDTASRLLSDLGQGAKTAVTAASSAYAGKRRGRPVGSKNRKTGIIFIGGRTDAPAVVNKIRSYGGVRKFRGVAPVEAPTLARRKMSAEARKAISMAQKARWAKLKAGAKKK
jgi:hypothetical protein